MAEKSWIFNSGAGDPRRYKADDFAEYFAQLVRTGVLDLGDNLRVTESGGGSHVDEGYAWMNGYMYSAYDGGEILSHAATASIHVDRIILKLDLSDTERKITAEVKQGTGTPPALTRAGDVYEISLARATVDEAGNVISIVDERDDPEVCGIATIAKNMQEEWEQFLADQVAASFTPLADFNDHVGARGVAEHDVATTSEAGFMSAADKTKVDNVNQSNYGQVTYTDTINPLTTITKNISIGAGFRRGTLLIPDTGSGGAGTVIFFTTVAQEAKSVSGTGSSYPNYLCRRVNDYITGGISTNIYVVDVFITGASLRITIRNVDGSTARTISAPNWCWEVWK